VTTRDRTPAAERSRLLASQIESLRTDLELRRPPGLDSETAERLTRRLEEVSRGIRRRGHVTGQDATAVRAVSDAVRDALRAPPRAVAPASQRRRRENA